MSYGPHRTDRAFQQEEQPDEPDCNELIDTPPNEDGRLHQFIEDLLSSLEPYEGNVYDGTDSDDPGFYSDEPY